MIDITIDELIKKSKIDLCETCLYKQPICRPNVIIWGNGRGNDNVIVCNLYRIDKEKVAKIEYDRLNKKG